MKTEEEIKSYLYDAETNAIKNMARGKWSLFGYWAAQSVHLRRILGVSSTPSPFREFKLLADDMLERKFNF